MPDDADSEPKVGGAGTADADYADLVRDLNAADAALLERFLVRLREQDPASDTPEMSFSGLKRRELLWRAFEMRRLVARELERGLANDPADTTKKFIALTH